MNRLNGVKIFSSALHPKWVHYSNSSLTIESLIPLEYKMSTLSFVWKREGIFSNPWQFSLHYTPIAPTGRMRLPTNNDRKPVCPKSWTPPAHLYKVWPENRTEEFAWNNWCPTFHYTKALRDPSPAWSPHVLEAGKATHQTRVISFDTSRWWCYQHQNTDLQALLHFNQHLRHVSFPRQGVAM